jgi:hypothetical protein
VKNELFWFTANLAVGLNNYVSRHEGVWWNGLIALSNLISAVDGSGELHALATLAQKQERTVITGLDSGWDLKPVWTLWRKEKCLTSDENGTAAIKPVSHRYSDWAIYPWSQSELLCARKIHEINMYHFVIKYLYLKLVFIISIHLGNKMNRTWGKCVERTV